MSMRDNRIIAMAGLPASGKSAIALRLHEKLDSILLNKDHVRDLLFQQYVDYTNEQNDLCLDTMYQVTSYLLSRDSAPIIIIDGRSYSRKSQIDALKSIVTRANAKLFLIECVCSDESAKRRLKLDEGVHPARDRDYALYVKSKSAAEPLEEPRLILDTDNLSVDKCARRAMEFVTGSICL